MHSICLWPPPRTRGCPAQGRRGPCAWAPASCAVPTRGGEGATLSVCLSDPSHGLSVHLSAYLRLYVCLSVCLKVCVRLPVTDSHSHCSGCLRLSDSDLSHGLSESESVHLSAYLRLYVCLSACLKVCFRLPVTDGPSHGHGSCCLSTVELEVWPGSAGPLRRNSVRVCLPAHMPLAAHGCLSVRVCLSVCPCV